MLIELMMEFIFEAIFRFLGGIGTMKQERREAFDREMRDLEARAARLEPEAPTAAWSGYRDAPPMAAHPMPRIGWFEARRKRREARLALDLEKRA